MTEPRILIAGVDPDVAGLKDRLTSLGYAVEDLPLVRAMQGEVVDDIEILVRNRQRPEVACFDVKVRPLQDRRGKIIGGVIVGRDITKLKHTEEELQCQVAELQSQTRLLETVFNVVQRVRSGGHPVFSSL